MVPKTKSGIAVIVVVSIMSSTLADDVLYCPADNCKIYSNPFGLDGDLSEYMECYNPSTNEVSNGIKIDSNTTDTTTEVPNGWTNETELCTDYSECNSSADCQLLIAPGCSCYVSSCIHPYDANPDDSGGLSGCTGNECGGYVPQCSFANGTGGTCLLVDTSDIDYDSTMAPSPSPQSPNACDEPSSSNEGVTLKSFVSILIPLFVFGMNSL